MRAMSAKSFRQSESVDKQSSGFKAQRQKSNSRPNSRASGNKFNDLEQIGKSDAISAFTNVDIPHDLTTRSKIQESPILLGRETLHQTSSSKQSYTPPFRSPSPGLKKKESLENLRQIVEAQNLQRVFAGRSSPLTRNSAFKQNGNNSPSPYVSKKSGEQIEGYASPLQKITNASPGLPLSQTEIIASKSSGAFKSKRVSSFGSVEKKRVINKYGLQVEPICSAHKHKRLKYVCLDPSCKEKERVLCDECIDTFGHTLHEFKSIEEYLLLVESSYETFTRKYFHAKQLREGLEHPPFLGGLNQQISETKKLLIIKLDALRDQLVEQYQDRLGDTGPSKELLGEEITRMEEIGGFLQEISSKNFFDISRSELNLSLALISRDHFISLEQLSSNIQNKYSQLEKLFTEQFEIFQSSIGNALNEVFDRFKFCIPIQVKNDNKKGQENQIKKLQELEQEIKEKRKQMKLVVENMHLEQKQSRNKRVVTSTSYFPYNTYNECCQHLKERRIQCNTIPIFECCQQAYQCIECHFLFSKHTPTISNPSKRYCMKCLSVFKVDYPTEVSINCDDCLQRL